MKRHVKLISLSEVGAQVGRPLVGLREQHLTGKVLVELGAGRFEPRVVKLGTRGGGYVEVLEGVKAGEAVVVSANFLIDAESNLKAALETFGGHSGHDSVQTKPGAAKPAPANAAQVHKGH